MQLSLSLFYDADFCEDVRSAILAEIFDAEDLALLKVIVQDYLTDIHNCRVRDLLVIMEEALSMSARFEPRRPDPPSFDPPYAS